MIARIVTIGVYGFDEERFYNALQTPGVDLLCDIRRRRGVRGAEYAFANSQRLQRGLEERGIGYLHYLPLAPTADIREQQAAADRLSKTARRQRQALDEAFVVAYRQQVLNAFDLETFLTAVGDKAQTIALLCVEREPAACHRSLVAAHLSQALSLPIEDIRP